MIVTILLVIALVLFICTSIGIASRINLGWAGLACLTVVALLGQGTL